MAGKKSKIILSAIGIITLLIAIVYYAIFIYPTSHHRNIQNENSVVVTTDQLVKEFTENEKNANLHYLNKALIIEGAILSIDTDQAGFLHIIMGNANAFSNISITFMDHPVLKVGQKIKIKGLCTGFLSDVIITEAKVQQ